MALLCGATSGVTGLVIQLDGPPPAAIAHIASQEHAAAGIEMEDGTAKLIPATFRSIGFLAGEQPRAAQQGLASWYGDEFAGRPTASGEVFDPYEMTAAHRSLPMGSTVQVTNLENGEQVILRINDRGPYAGKRVLDVSEEAARQLGMHRAGEAEVQIQVLDEGSEGA